MFDEIIVWLDGSPLAETILPLARGLAETGEKNLALRRVVEDVEELASEEEGLRAIARQYRAELRFRISEDAGAAILDGTSATPNSYCGAGNPRQNCPCRNAYGQRGFTHHS